jgi:Restriction endonuclease
VRPGPYAAVKLLPAVLRIDSPPRSARDVLIEIAMSEGWYIDPGDAAEAAEKWEDRFLVRLRRESSAFSAIGRVCLHAFNSSSEYMIQGSAFVETHVDSPELQAAKGNRARFANYYAALSALTPTEFEAMCRGIVALLGVQEPQLTATSSDEGIDFYGRLRLEDLLPRIDALPDVYRQLTAWMIGQAKHYQATQVATPDIRDLVGAINLARGKAFGSNTPAYEDMNILVCDPVFYLFFTTGTISADGWRLLERSGVVGMDGHMVAAFLADQGVGLVNGTFDVSELRRWLAKYVS